MCDHVHTSVLPLLELITSTWAVTYEPEACRLKNIYDIRNANRRLFDGSMCLVCCHCPDNYDECKVRRYRVDVFLETCRHEKTDVQYVICGLGCVNVTKLSLPLMLFMSCIEPYFHTIQNSSRSALHVPITPINHIINHFDWFFLYCCCIYVFRPVILTCWFQVPQIWWSLINGPPS